MIDAVAGSWSECATALTNSPATAVRFWLSVASSAQPRTATCDRYALAATADAARGAKRASAATDLQAFDRRVCDQFPVRMRSSLRQRCGISSDRTPTAFGASGESCPSSPVDRQRAASSSRRGGVSVLAHFGVFRRTHPASIHPFVEAEDRLFTTTFALECRPMDLPGRQRVGLPCSTS